MPQHHITVRDCEEARVPCRGGAVRPLVEGDEVTIVPEPTNTVNSAALRVLDASLLMRG